MPDHAGVLAFRENHLALVRERYEHWNSEHRNLPSGALEPGESPGDAAIRELHEEAGLIVTADQLTLITEVHVISQDHTHHSTAWTSPTTPPKAS